MPWPQTPKAIVLTLLPTLVLWACINRSPGGEPPESTPNGQDDTRLEGHWRLMPVPPPQGTGSGIQIVVRIDSVRPPALYGQLTYFFSGDVGLDPTRFSRFDGTMTADSLVSFTIETDDSPPASFSIAGVFRSDTIRVTRFVVGPDTLTRGGRNWLLLRNAGER